MDALDRLAAGDLMAAMLAYRDGLRSHQEAINRLNVYPVPGGDTGTNMALTLDAATAAEGAVMRPVQGTILTVAADAATAARAKADAGGGLVDVLDAARVAATDSVARTPELLPVLKQAGVVDAGGVGFVLLLD